MRLLLACLCDQLGLVERPVRGGAGSLTACHLSLLDVHQQISDARVNLTPCIHASGGRGSLLCVACVRRAHLVNLLIGSLQTDRMTTRGKPADKPSASSRKKHTPHCSQTGRSFHLTQPHGFAQLHTTPHTYTYTHPTLTRSLTHKMGSEEE